MGQNRTVRTSVTLGNSTEFPSGVQRSETRPLISPLPGRYAVRDILGKGGMGVVYRVYDSELGLDVALKAMHGLGPQQRSWLKAEFRSLSNLVHPNLVQLYQLVVDEQNAFFTMELVRGKDLVRFVRAGASRLSEDAMDRLRDAARQLAHALASCHAADKLHRDVKPSNVLVTDAGRVVLLDFGLVAPIQHSSPRQAPEGAAPGHVIEGTVEYMSPEQVWGDPLSEAADWYCFGVTLFEALTGLLPIQGVPYQIIARKRRPVLTPPSHFEPSVPAEIDRLVLRLLSPNAAERPTDAEILGVLGGGSIRGLVSVPVSDRERSQATFVGRTEELAALQRAWLRARAGETAVVCLEGPSGIGKSELVRRFIDTPEVASDAWLLRGRCHPEEAVPFNALDGALDDLAAALGQHGPGPLAALGPEDFAALVRLFPALGSAPGSASAEGLELVAIPAQDVRRRALVALKAVLVALSGQRTTLMWLDDLQWGDSDSGTLLRELLRGADCPPLLLILSFRAEDHSTGAAMEILRREPSVLLSDRSLNLVLPPLGEVDSHELIHRLSLTQHQESGERLAELCREAAGSPFLLWEIGRYLRQGEDASNHSIRVGDMLGARTAQLPDNARTILDVVAIAGGPLEQRVILDAAGLTGSSLPLFGMLERLSVLRTAAGSGRTTEVYHHRLRDHVLGRLDAGQVRRYHRRVADALLHAPAPNLQSIVEHYEHSDETLAVRRYLVPAARQAADGFAFERAAAHYRRAIELGSRDLSEFELHTQLGHALANAGRAREAGEAYEHAADLLVASASSNRDQVLMLRRCAAEQYLQSGHDRPAVAALREVLKAHSVHLPHTRGEAIARAVVLRVRLLFRKLDIQPLTDLEAVPELLSRFDASWAVGMRLSMVNHAQVGYFAARCLELALLTRDPSRLALALGWEAATLAMMGSLFESRVRQMLALAEQCAASSGPYERAMVLALKAATEWLGGRFRTALELDDVASDLIRRSTSEFHWELAMFDTWALAALAFLGEYKELAARTRRLLAEADRRDDRYLARNCYLGEPSLVWLAADRPDGAIEMATRAIAWSPEEYTTQHYHYYLTVAHALLYKGDALAALRLTEREWPRLRNNLFLALSTVREELWRLRGSVTLAVADQVRAGKTLAGVGSVEALLRSVRKDAQRLRRFRTPLGNAWSSLLLAGVDCVAQRSAAACDQLRTAERELTACDLHGHANAARYCVGLLTRAEGGDSLQRRALDWFRTQEVIEPARFAHMLAPGFASADATRYSSSSAANEGQRTATLK